MRWAVQVSVVLVNIVWILFFLTTDDFSETVWRRSAEEEELIGEFCIQLPQVNVSLNQSSSPVTSEENKTLKAQPSKPEAETPIMDDYETTSRPPDPGLTSTGVVSTESSAPFRVTVNNKPEEDDHRNVSTTESLSSKIPSHCCQEDSPKLPSDFGWEPETILEDQAPPECPTVATVIKTTSGQRFCFYPLCEGREKDICPPLDLDEKTSASPDALRATSSDVSTDAGMSESSNSAASLFTNSHRSAAPLTPKNNQNRPGERPGSCCFLFIQRQIPLKIIKSYWVTDPQCPKRAIIIETTIGRKICMDPESEWWRRQINLGLIKKPRFN